MSDPERSPENMMRLVTLVFAIFLLIGCSRTVAADTGVDVAKKKWQADGWVFHEAFGTAIAGAGMIRSDR